MQETLAEYRRHFPQQVSAAKQQAMSLFKAGNLDALHTLVKQAQLTIKQWQSAGKSPRKDKSSQVINAKITLLVIETYCRAALAKTSSGGEVTLSSWDQWLAQRLFFTRDHQRRLPPAWLFRAGWALLRNKTAVMSAVQGQGIYCVYSTDLGRELQRIIGARKCLEVAAGDGTLTLLLERCDIDVISTDDHSWQHKVQFPDWVEKLAAPAALAKYQPEVVICSWPPSANDFEEKIFATSAVQTYIVIGSKHHFATGNRDAYVAARKYFMQRPAPELAALVLPAALDSEVLIFERMHGR